MIANGGRSGRWIVRGLVAQGVVKFPDWPDELERDDEEFKLCGNSRIANGVAWLLSVRHIAVWFARTRTIMTPT